MSDPETQRPANLLPVHRRPNIARFLIVGGFVGIVLGLIVAAQGDNAGYSASTASAMLAVVFGAIGVAIAGVVVVLVDKRSDR